MKTKEITIKVTLPYDIPEEELKVLAPPDYYPAQYTVLPSTTGITVTFADIDDLELFFLRALVASNKHIDAEEIGAILNAIRHMIVKRWEGCQG